VAEETSNQISSDAVSPAEHPNSVPASTSRPLEARLTDMSVFEELLADVPDLADCADCVPAVPHQRQPSVEWAIVWPDGRLTAVETEAAARFVTNRNPALRVACRLVGSWGPPDQPWPAPDVTEL
jgi:hypothetical protein